MTQSRQPTADPKPDSAGVAVHPPVLVGLALLAGLGLEAVAPLGAGLLAGPAWAMVAGAGLLVAGAGFMAWAIGSFRRAGTNVPTFQPTLALVTGGPYAMTRNPIYVGGSVAFAGLAGLLSSPWVLLMLVPVVLVLHFGVVRREEAYLTRLFGEAYRDYCRRVPRWIGF